MTIKPAIILSAHTMGLGVIRALGTKRIPIVAVTYDEKDYGYCSRYVGWKVKAAHPEKERNQFISQLIALADRFGGGLLVPASDESLVAVSKNAALLKKYYVVASAQWEVIEMIIDKSRTYACAKAAGVPIPKTLTPKTVDEVREYGQAVSYPCLVKPKQSHLFYDKFGEKMVKAHNAEELTTVFLKAAEEGLEVMVQEFIPGDDSQVVNYNSYFWENEPVIEFTAQQIRKAPPEIGAPCIVKSKRIPEIIEIGRKMIRATGFNGFSCTEFKLDPRDGVFKLMEINGRYNLSGSLAVYCGINFPWLEYMNLMQGVVLSDLDWKEGIYWIDFARDVATVMKSSRRAIPLGSILLPYCRRHVIAEFCWRDPLPLLKRIFQLSGRFCRKQLFNLGHWKRKQPKVGVALK